MTKTVCIRGMSKAEIEAAGIVYIGRPCPRRGLRGHKLANPYVIGRDGTREEVIANYRAYLLASPDLLMIVETLRGGTLGCFCDQSEDCHAKVVADVADGIAK